MSLCVKRSVVSGTIEEPPELYDRGAVRVQTFAKTKSCYAKGGAKPFSWISQMK